MSDVSQAEIDAGRLERRRTCYACGTIGFGRLEIRTTNGHLVLCEQCIGDINRKSPLLTALRERHDRLATALATIAEHHTDRCIHSAIHLCLFDVQKIARAALAAEPKEPTQ